MSAKKPFTLPSFKSPSIPTTNELKEVIYRFQPRGKKQTDAQRLYATHDVLFLLGPAGTGKTFLALALALGDILNKASPRKSALVLRPHIECGPSMGFRKGTTEEKMLPFTKPITDNLAKIAFNLPPTAVKIEAPEFSRGLSYESQVIILDESQNIPYTQFKMLITRLGTNSKLIITGDPLQCDLPRPSCPDPDYDTDLDFIADRLEPIKGVSVVEFDAKDAVHRHPLLPSLLKAIT